MVVAQREAVDLAEVLVVVRSDIIFMTIDQSSDDHEGIIDRVHTVTSRTMY